LTRSKQDDQRILVEGHSSTGKFQSVQRPILLASDLAMASAGASRQIAARLRARFVCAAHELSRALYDAQSDAVAVDHPHVCAIAIEPNEFVGTLTKACVIVTGHAHVRFEPRKTAGSAGETFWNRWHFDAPAPRYLIETRADEELSGALGGYPAPNRKRRPSVSG
jgi:hypothetical protein